MIRKKQGNYEVILDVTFCFQVQQFLFGNCWFYYLNVNSRKEMVRIQQMIYFLEE